MSKGKILIVDDEKLVRWALREDFQKGGYEVDEAADGVEALAKIDGDAYLLILLDIRLPGENGIEVLRKAKQIDPDLIVIMMTAYGDIETAVEAMKAGANDYVTKPFNLDELRTRVERAFEILSLKEEVSYFRKFQREQLGADQFIGRSRPVRDLFDLIRKVAKGDSTVLLLGESGTGKDLVARYIHFRSSRAEHPLVDINCAALPEALLESELMGHEKGAFTDARTLKKGLFEQAHRGTVFLDEIGDMPPAIQGKVLKLIETKRFRRLGGLNDIETDARVIAATNKDLESLMREGKMREDLYYRLKVMSLRLPPLRERKSDIPLLATYFFRQWNRGHSGRKMSLSKEALKLLAHYDWPGNVRQLKNVIERAVILAEDGEILPSHLPPEIVSEKVTGKGFALRDLEIPSEGLPLEEVEREVIKKALAMTEGNLSKAARILSITRDTLRYRIKRLNLTN